MTRIYVVGTVHEEKGLATTSALLAILRGVRPDAVFLEIPPESFAAFDEGTCSNLESRAARQYREATGAVLVPVDLPVPEESFFRNWQYMDRRIAATSPAYRQLIDENANQIAKQGFFYLNSKRCRDAWAAIYEAMEVAIQRLSHDASLPAIYKNWRRTNGLRERAMLQGIDTHFSLAPFREGVLLVGVAHVHSIVNRSRKGRRTHAPRIDYWDPR